VYHAKEMVYNYNLLPPFSLTPLKIGKRAAIIGAGNVMADVSRYLIHHRKVDEVIDVVRRGPLKSNLTARSWSHLSPILTWQTLMTESSG